MPSSRYGAETGSAFSQPTLCGPNVNVGEIGNITKVAVDLNVDIAAILAEIEKQDIRIDGEIECQIYIVHPDFLTGTAGITSVGDFSIATAGPCAAGPLKGHDRDHCPRVAERVTDMVFRLQWGLLELDAIRPEPGRRNAVGLV